MVSIPFLSSSGSAPVMDSPYVVLSDLPGRLRIGSERLNQCPDLRRHCFLTLSRCHWLDHLRVNALAGSVCLKFQEHRRALLPALLLEALTLPLLDHDAERLLEALVETPNSLSPVLTRILGHGGTCALLLFLELLLPVPAILVGTATAAMLLPAARKAWKSLLQRRELPQELLEVGFSSLMISQGLSSETLVHLTFADVTAALQNVAAVDVTESTAIGSGTSGVTRYSRDLFSQMGKQTILQLSSPSPGPRALVEVRAGDRFEGLPRSYVYLQSRVISGEIAVLTRLVNGNYCPHVLGPGDQVAPGTFVIRGSAELEVLLPMQDHVSYGLPQDLELFEARTSTNRFEIRLEAVRKVLLPFTLAFGSYWFATGATHRALGVLQFNPISDWKISQMASRLTAMAQLKPHGLRIQKPSSLPLLGQVQDVVISRSCLDSMGGMEVRAHAAADLAEGDTFLESLLAGTQAFLTTHVGLSLLSNQLLFQVEPLEVQGVDLAPQGGGWDVSLANGRFIQLREALLPQKHISGAHDTALEVRDGDQLLGHLELVSTPQPRWTTLCRTLQQMGIRIHLVGAESQAAMEGLVGELELNETMATLQGECSSEQRFHLVQQLQAQGSVVAYVGYTVADMQALAQADVSLGVDIDDESLFIESLCDVLLGTDIFWIARIIALGRRLESTTNSNFALIGSTHLISVVATMAGWINPLQTLLLSDLPLCLAEVRNLTTLSARPAIAAASMDQAH